MHLDVRELREFYYRSTLGRAVQRTIRDQVLRLWPNANSDTMVGYGFAVPLLRPYLHEARRVTALMPGPQGVMHWPAGEANRSVLCHETLWPVENESVDKLLVLHGLDTSDHPSAVLEECYRVLKPQGRAIFVVPNRASLWSRREGTPFSFSRPYTTSQLEKRLRWHGFLPHNHVTALYQPPWTKGIWRRLSPAIERIGQKIPAWHGGGVLICEVSKQ
ncbi:MAG: class I SAM-dependent methyltransferase, partial [Planktomarina sp.]